MLGLTQEPMEELEAYQNLGQKIPNFTSLSELQFPIGIENGAMFKAYQLKNNITTYPHCYIVGKDQLLKWHGHPFGSFEVRHRLLTEIGVRFISNPVSVSFG